MFWSWHEPGGEGCDCGCQKPTSQQCSGGCESCGSSTPPPYVNSNITTASSKKINSKVTPPPKKVNSKVITPPSWHTAIVPGSQHFVMMLGTVVTISNVLVPRMGGGSVEKAEVINTFLFVAGFNTLFQNLFGVRLPVVMGGSISSVVPTLYIASSRRFLKCTDEKQRFKHTMRAVQGAQIISSLFQTALGYSGLWKKCARALSPLAAAPLVIDSGLGRLAQGFPELFDKKAEFHSYGAGLSALLPGLRLSLTLKLGFLHRVSNKLVYSTKLAKCIEVGLPELIIVIILSQYVSTMLKVSKRKLLKQNAVTVSVAIVWAYGAILTAAGVYDNRPIKTQTSCRTDRSGLINATPWVRIPRPFQWGRPTFQAGDALTMIAASFVSTIESTGTYIAASRYARKEPMPPSAHSRALVWQGIGSLLHSIFGSGTGSNASLESAGHLGLTEFPKRRVTEVSAVLMILSSALGKPGALLASVPLPITAALNCIHYGYVASSGIGRLRYHKKRNRSKFILGFALFMGLSVPLYFNGFQLISYQGPVYTDSIWFNTTMQVIFSSPATVAAFVAFFFDSTIPCKATRRRKHNRWPRWKKIKKFYSLPSIDLDRINSFLKWKNLRKYLIKLLKCCDSSSDSKDDEIPTDEDEWDDPEVESDDPQEESDEPREESDEPQEESDDPEEESDDPEVESDDPRDESDDPQEESDDPQDDRNGELV